MNIMFSTKAKLCIAVVALLAITGCMPQDDTSLQAEKDSTPAATQPEPGIESQTEPQSSPEAAADNDDQANRTDGSFSSGEWPLFRGNATSQGVAASSLPDKLDVIWQHEIPNGAFEGTPIIVNPTQPRVYIGDADGSLLAMNLETGAVLWEFKSEIGYVTAPAFHDDLIYVGDLDGKFYCLNESGEKIWEFSAEDSIDSSANFYKDLVLFGSRDAKLYALDAKTGRSVWQLETADQVRCSITVVDGRAFVAGCDGALHIIDLDTGKEIDSVLIESPTGVTPAAQGELIFVGTEQSGFYAIDWKQAELKWTYNDVDGPISTRSSPSIVGDHVVFGARNRKMYSLNPISGNENWATELKANIDSSPVIVGNRIFIGSTDGRLYELELQTGKIIWQKQFDGGFIGSPAVGLGKLVIATDTGVVYCLGSKK